MYILLHPGSFPLNPRKGRLNLTSPAVFSQVIAGQAQFPYPAVIAASYRSFHEKIPACFRFDTG